MANLNESQKEQILKLEQQLGMAKEVESSYLKKVYAVNSVDELNEVDAEKYIKGLKKSIEKKSKQEQSNEATKTQQTDNKNPTKDEVANIEPAKPVSQKIKEFEISLKEELNLQTKSLPINFNKERFVSNCMNLMLDPNKNKIDWDKLDKKEVIKCLIDGAKYDCEYGKEFYIIPFYNKNINRQVATIMFDYKGLLRAMKKFSYKPIKNIIVSVVYEGDEFEVLPLTYPPITHKMKFATTDDKKITFAYCFIDYHDGGYDFEVLTREQLNQIEHTTKNESSKFWKDWYSEMARKSAVRRISKRVPLDFPSAEVEKVWRDDLERDNAYDPSEQNKEEHKVIDIVQEVADV